MLHTTPRPLVVKLGDSDVVCLGDRQASCLAMVTKFDFYCHIEFRKVASSSTRPIELLTDTRPFHDSKLFSTSFTRANLSSLYENTRSHSVNCISSTPGYTSNSSCPLLSWWKFIKINIYKNSTGQNGEYLAGGRDRFCLKYHWRLAPKRGAVVIS